jgi:hypothetical protein
VDIFQQWLLIKIEEEFGAGRNPLENAISFDSIMEMLKPLFEQEDAVLDEDEVRNQLGALAELGYLTETDGNYFLTLRAVVYAQAAPSMAQTAKDEFRQFIRAHWWKAVGILILLVIVVTVITASIIPR